MALCDSNIGRLRFAEESLKKSNVSVRLYLEKDFQKLLRTEEPEVVIVTSPDYTHHKYIIAAARKGCQIISEKPLTNNLENLKKIVDDALKICKTDQRVLLVKRTNESVSLVEKRDFLLENLIVNIEDTCEAEIMDAEDPLFILYTSGSTGKPKGMVHTCGGYMVYTSYTFKNIFQYEENDIYWCTADIGWITGHSYILYGPLSNGATTIMFEGVPSYPDFSRFWQIVDKYKVNQFYTAPTAIRALAKQGVRFLENNNLSSLKVLGTVGEPINEEAWQWYNIHVGKDKCPIVDTWWQTETGGILISSIPKVVPDKPTFATKPFIGVQPILIDENGNELDKANVVGKLCIKYPCAPCISKTLKPASADLRALSANALTNSDISASLIAFGVCQPSANGTADAPTTCQPGSPQVLSPISTGFPPSQGGLAEALRPA